jgi:hypothetical protein
MRQISKPYFRPGEQPRAFAKLARQYRSTYKPKGPEAEALVEILAHIHWRIERYRLDERLILQFAEDHPGQPQTLEVIAQVIKNLEQLCAWTMTTFRYFEELDKLETAQAMDDAALNPDLGSFRQKAADPQTRHIPCPPPPETKPN